MVLKKRERIWNLPNMLSAYRLVAFPYILYLIYTEKQTAYLLLFCISLVTDILDGAIARMFKLQTTFGAKLDSVADVGSYVLAAYGLLQFKWNELSNVSIGIWIYVAVFISVYLLSFIKFGKFPSLHLYSSKIAGLIDGAFFFYLFFVGYNSLFLWIALGWGIASLLEMIGVLLVLRELRSDCRGLYWVMKDW
ncbi:MAG: CDP-alcohol phosphatidyltransferase family protein [Bacteroidetes bacterium]|nr:CDP-alcohol phosphatidyltransferase family protein [Bacteroidota bacterium]